MNWTLGVVDTVLCLTAGIGVGVVYFWGLWLTLKKVKTVKRYGRLLVFSWFVRNAFMLGAFYLIMQNDWQRLVAAFAGVMIVRFASISFAKKKNREKEADDGKL